MQWDPNEVVDSRVVSYSEWWINLKDFGELEPRAGVYLFANSNPVFILNVRIQSSCRYNSAS